MTTRHDRAQEDGVANKGNGDDYNYKKAAARNFKQDRQEQKRQEQKARKAGKAERAGQAWQLRSPLGRRRRGAAG